MLGATVNTQNCFVFVNTAEGQSGSFLKKKAVTR